MDYLTLEVGRKIERGNRNIVYVAEAPYNMEKGAVRYWQSTAKNVREHNDTRVCCDRDRKVLARR